MLFGKNYSSFQKTVEFYVGVNQVIVGGKIRKFLRNLKSLKVLIRSGHIPILILAQPRIEVKRTLDANLPLSETPKVVSIYLSSWLYDLSWFVLWLIEYPNFPKSLKCFLHSFFGIGKLIHLSIFLNQIVKTYFTLYQLE